jgi:hypothetical protein
LIYSSVLSFISYLHETCCHVYDDGGGGDDENWKNSQLLGLQVKELELERDPIQYLLPPVHILQPLASPEQK